MIFSIIRRNFSKKINKKNLVKAFVLKDKKFTLVNEDINEKYKDIHKIKFKSREEKQKFVDQWLVDMKINKDLL